MEQGDNIPADCRLVEAFDVKVNTATVTGKSISKARDAAPSQQSDLVHSRNILLAGTSMVAGEGKALVYATGSHTEFGQIAHLAQTSRTTVSPLRKELKRLSRLIAILAVAIGAVFFAVGAGIGVPFWKDLIFSIGIIVAMVPEGLLPTLTLSLVLAAQRMAKRKVLIRNLTSVETLGSATVICTDKTGTLTRNRMQVSEVALDGRRHRVADLEGDRSIVARHRDFFVCANFCHDVREFEDRRRPRAARRSDGDRADRDASQARGRCAALSASRRDPVRQRPDASGRGAGVRPTGRSSTARGRRRRCLPSAPSFSRKGRCTRSIKRRARRSSATRTQWRKRAYASSRSPRGTCRPAGRATRLSSSSSSKG